MRVYDLDQLVLSSTELNLGIDGNVWVDTVNKTIALVPYGALNAIEGVKMNALYSFLKKVWYDNNTLIEFDFAGNGITSDQVEFRRGWVLKDAATEAMIRDGGYAVKDINGIIVEERVCLITLGSIGAADTIYLTQESITNPPTFPSIHSGNVNNVHTLYAHNYEGIVLTTGTIASTTAFNDIYAVGAYVNVVDSANGNDGSYQILSISLDRLTLTMDAVFVAESLTPVTVNVDFRKDLGIYARTYGRTYSHASVTTMGLSTLTFDSLVLPLSTSGDANILNDDITVSTTLPYTGMSISYYLVPQVRLINGVSYSFDIIVDGGINNPTKEEIYEFVQYSLRQPTNIDSNGGIHIGNVSDELLKFDGATLKTTTGVYIDNLSNLDKGFTVFTDNVDVEVAFPFTASGSIFFDTNLQVDTGGWYRMFFSDTYGTPTALTVNDNDGIPIAGDILGATQAGFTFDYDGNVQGSRVAGVDANVTIVCGGLETAQLTIVTATLSRTNSNNINSSSVLELSYI